MDDLTIVLLAGGAATRLPGKLALPIDGEPMLARTYRRLTEAGACCIISVREPLDPALSAAIAGDVVMDEIPDGGPLGGLLSSVRHVRTPLFMAVAGDLPDIDSDFIKKLVELYRARTGAGQTPAAVLPTWPDGKVEPLAALYATQIWIEGAERAIERGKRKVTAALEELEVVAYRVTPEDERVLANVNTPEDYARRTQAGSSA